MDIDIKQIGETLTAGGVIGTALVWIFREKLQAWVRGQTRERLRGLEGRMDGVEKAQANHEGELMRIAEAMERTSENLGEAVQRLTMSLERIVDGHEEIRAHQQKTAEIVARVDERTQAMQRQAAR